MCVYIYIHVLHVYIYIYIIYMYMYIIISYHIISYHIHFYIYISLSLAYISKYHRHIHECRKATIASVGQRSSSSQSWPRLDGDPAARSPKAFVALVKQKPACGSGQLLRGTLCV